MIKFVIYEDNEQFKKIIKRVINKLMFPISEEFKIIYFSNYGNLLETTIKQVEERKIYILGISVGNVSGLDIARKIRDYDWRSIIIILSIHYDLIYDALKTRLMLLDFISKYDDYEIKLMDSLQIALKAVRATNLLNLEYKHNFSKIDLNSIVYLTTDLDKRRTVIRTYSEIYYSNKTLYQIKNDLPDFFKYSHRACIINSNNIKSLDLKNKRITFINNEIVSLLSEKYKKDIINICKK